MILKLYIKHYIVFNTFNFIIVGFFFLILDFLSTQMKIKHLFGKGTLFFFVFFFQGVLFASHPLQINYKN